MIEIKHEGEAETDMRFGEDPDQANGVTLIEFIWIYVVGFIFGAIFSGVVMWL